jgi:hypothetical protein
MNESIIGILADQPQIAVVVLEQLCFTSSRQLS